VGQRIEDKIEDVLVSEIVDEVFPVAPAANKAVRAQDTETL